MKPIFLATLAALGVFCISCATVEPPSAEFRPAPTKHRNDPLTPSELKAIIKRLDEVKIREINFQKADINVVIDFLVDECRRMHPEGMGVSITVREVPAGRQIRSLRLRDIKFLDVLRVICDLADMRYIIERRGIVIVPADSSYGIPFETKSFSVSPALIRHVIESSLVALLRTSSVPPPPMLNPLSGAQVPPINLDAPAPRDMVMAFEDIGVEFPRGANLSYSPALRKLTITNTVKNIKHLEKLLPELEAARKQFEIERRLEQKISPLDETTRELRDVIGRTSDNDWVNRRQEIVALEGECFKLARQVRVTRDAKQRAELVKQLEVLLGKLHDAQIAALEKEIGFLQSNVNTRKKEKNKAIQSRLGALTTARP